MHGTQAQLLSKQAIDLPSAAHIGFVQTITDDLETEMVLTVNGFEVDHVRTPNLVMLPTDRSGYRVLVNRAPDEEDSGCHLGLLEIYIWKALLAEKERAQAVVKIYKDMERKSARVAALTPSQFAVAQDGGSNLQFSGDARLRNLSKFLGKERKP